MTVTIGKRSLDDLLAPLNRANLAFEIGKPLLTTEAINALKQVHDYVLQETSTYTCFEVSENKYPTPVPAVLEIIREVEVAIVLLFERRGNQIDFRFSENGVQRLDNSEILSCKIDELYFLTDLVDMGFRHPEKLVKLKTYDGLKVFGHVAQRFTQVAWEIATLIAKNTLAENAPGEK